MGSGLHRLRIARRHPVVCTKGYSRLMRRGNLFCQMEAPFMLKRTAHNRYRVVPATTPICHIIERLVR